VDSAAVFPVVAVQQAAGKENVMHCPKCKSTLNCGKTKRGSYNIEYCPKCKGIWFDKQDLRQLTDVAINKLKVTRNAYKLTIICPKCDKPLYAFYYPQTMVTIDMCKKCEGFWLDAGEFREIETVRRSLKKKLETKECPDPDGIKGALINFIDRAIEELSFDSRI
jgi:Zn-finger nucleic acid-binding protein